MNARETEIFEKDLFKIRVKTDKVFMVLFGVQWLLAIIISLSLAPHTWSGTVSSIHPHVYISVFGGALLSVYPMLKFALDPGAKGNAYIAAVSQMSYSILLIHITGGRIETHFHIFGSLAYLSFYRNKYVVILATVITTLDHILRGAFYPMSLYGVMDASLWRALEHASWVIFEDIVLIAAVNGMLVGLKDVARREAALEEAVANTERLVDERTRDLLESQKLVLEQQQTMVNSARLSSLGEMAAGIAHEINNPLAIISNTSKFIKKKFQTGKLTPESLDDATNDIDTTVMRISGIIQGLRNISRDAASEKVETIKLSILLDDVLSICSERFRNHSVDLQLDRSQFDTKIVSCRRIQLSQVIVNLLNNSFDAVQELSGEKWIRMTFDETDTQSRILVADSGKGIPQELKDKIFKPFYTTKDVGKGTGLGLSLAQSIIEKHGGTLTITEGIPNTEFVISVPRF